MMSFKGLLHEIIFSRVIIARKNLRMLVIYHQSFERPANITIVNVYFWYIN